MRGGDGRQEAYWYFLFWYFFLGLYLKEMRKILEQAFRKVLSFSITRQFPRFLLAVPVWRRVVSRVEMWWVR